MNQNNQQPVEPSRASRIEWSLRQIIEADDAQALTQEIIEAGRSALAPHPAQPVEADAPVPLDLSELDLWSPIAGSKMEVDNACGQYVRFADVQSLLATHPAEPVGGDVRAALQFIHDTFKRDLDAGYKTRDKEFAVAIAAEALQAPVGGTLVASDEPLWIQLGQGKIEVGQGHHGPNGERLPAILFGLNGAGAVGIETEGDRVMNPGECIAAITFENPESLDVVAEKLAELRARIWPGTAPAGALVAEQRLIQPASVQRDEAGYWSHPDMPQFEEGESEKFRAWAKSQGLEITYRSLENEHDNDPAYIAYFERGENTCAGWEPTEPRGEGWFVLAIDATEDGPQCWWARRTAAPTESVAAPAESEDAARWDFMMRVADDPEGPEAQAVEKLGNEKMEDDRSNSAQMRELVDAARALLATNQPIPTKGNDDTDKGEGHA